ncbi:MAG: hypothetical protein ACYS80_25385 [Planctomycetota bacterium]|jgi:hypothetical protein
MFSSPLFYALLICFFIFPVEDIDVPERELEDYPAVVTYYEPLNGGHNCDDDCSTMSTGVIEEWMYGEYMACHVDLLGAYVTFEGIGTWRCMDTGGMITILWSPHYGEYVLFFDALLHETPEWNFWRWSPSSWHISSSPPS